MDAKNPKLKEKGVTKSQWKEKSLMEFHGMTKRKIQ